MRQKTVVEEVKELTVKEESLKQDSANLISGEVIEVQSEAVEESSEFTAEYDADAGIVTFKLTDGTPVAMKSPKTRQFLLLESFINSAEPEYKTESFLVLKLAALCTTKYGKNTSVSFDYLLDNLEGCDMKRVAAAITVFQDKFEFLSTPTIH
ncbi:hypothetical protein [Nostoc sp. ChiQUE01b]|uniref:hypothetical protein n=1 Tax=Nostoc sp. ChiQUE01b TaxID=3075376 RepID=UPI002AD3E004|nr:hypothetical protein [Nostoc sp. ChiQUE01b]MDZ8259451.1 hypothetical protein [Nostoc sp. ChiQUE01b]